MTLKYDLLQNDVICANIPTNLTLKLTNQTYGFQHRLNLTLRVQERFLG